MLTRQEPLVRPRPFERRVEILLAHHVALRLAAVEFLHRLVQRGAIHDRVMGSDGHSQNVDVLVLERAGEVVVHLVEAQRERALDRATSGLGRSGLRLERGQPFQRRLGDLGGRQADRRAGRRQIEGLEHELRDATRALAA